MIVVDKENIYMSDILNFKNGECKYFIGSKSSYGHDCSHDKNKNYRNACDTRNCPRLQGLNTYKCVACGRVGNEGDLFFQVKIITCDGQILFVPACSEQCAINTKEQNYLLHLKRADEIKNCSVQKMKWE